jgi:hypothetical protein
MAVPALKDAIEHLQRKDLEAAIASLERKVEELPAHLTAHVLLARAYEADHQWQKALTCWENVCFLMPNSPVGQEGKARTLRRLTRETEAAGDTSSPEPAPPESASGEAAASSPSPPAPDASAPDAEEASSSPPDGLAQLRQRAEAEARSGGARPELADRPSPSEAESDEPAPEERVGQLEDEDDLDRLIEKLESARIEPPPDAEGEAPPPDLDNEVDDLVSETLARIHEAQDQYRKAARIYVRLASQEPERAREYLEAAARMRRKAEAASEDAD